MSAVNQEADRHPKILRISLSARRVKIGNLSRDGKDRTLEARKADDHDSQWSAVLVPFGILEVREGQLSIYWGNSAETSDFIVDCLAAWWQERKSFYSEMEEFVIDLDGGMSQRSNRTQFIKRMVEFSRQIEKKFV